MTTERAAEIMEMFPAEKPVCFNYQSARNIVMELLDELNCSRILNVIITLWHEIRIEKETWVNMYRVRDDVEDPAEAFRAAIVKFCESEEGANMVRYAGGSPNWGDISTHKPDDFLRSCGFYPFGESIAMAVDHDEVVYSPDSD